MDNSNTNRIFAIIYYEKYSAIMDKELTIKDIMEIAAKDESRVLELKQSTGELYKAMTSACAFLNTDGGMAFLWRHSQTTSCWTECHRPNKAGNRDCFEKN